MDNQNNNGFTNIQQQPQPQPTQPQADPYVPNTYVQLPPEEEVTSVGDWFLTILLMCIPCVGIIMLFVWAFGGSTQKSKANWAKAQLIWVAIGIIISVIFYLLLGAAILELAGSLQ